MSEVVVGTTVMVASPKTHWAVPCTRYTTKGERCKNDTLRFVLTEYEDGFVSRRADCGRHEPVAVVPKPCTCMTEDPGDGLGERVVTHSLSCPEHPEYDPGRCSGCGEVFKGAKGLKAHQSKPFITLACKPVKEG